MRLEQYFGEDYRYIWSNNWCLDNDRAWFIAGAVNILFCLDLNTKKTRVVDKIPADNPLGFRQHPTCVKVSDLIICLPDHGRDIWCYHIYDGSWTRIPLEAPDKIRVGCYNFWTFFDKLYVISTGLKKIIEVDIKSETVINYYDICLSKEKILYESTFADGCIYTVCSFPVNIYKFNCKSKQIEKYELHEINDEIHTLCFDGEKFWLSGRRKKIYIWRERTGEIKTLSELPKEFGVWNFSGKYNQLLNFGQDIKDTRLFFTSIAMGKHVWFIPFHSNEILLADQNTYEIKTFFLENEGQVEYDMKNQLLRHKYLLECVTDNRYIILFSLKNTWIVKIDTQTLCYSILDFTLDAECKSQIYRYVLLNKYKDTNLLPESESFTLKELIYYLTLQEKEEIDKDSDTLYGDSIYKIARKLMIF